MRRSSSLTAGISRIVVIAPGVTIAGKTAAILTTLSRPAAPPRFMLRRGLFLNSAQMSSEVVQCESKRTRVKFDSFTHLKASWEDYVWVEFSSVTQNDSCDPVAGARRGQS